jgi:hypothetical protein
MKLLPEFIAFSQNPNMLSILIFLCLRNLQKFCHVSKKNCQQNFFDGWRIFQNSCLNKLMQTHGYTQKINYKFYIIAVSFNQFFKSPLQ